MQAQKVCLLLRFHTLGHNGQVAFGLTIFPVDQEDLYIYETGPGTSPSYRYLDDWEPMEVVSDVIAVRGSEPVTVELRFTRHGPVISEDAERRAAFAVRAAWLETGMAPYLASIALMSATPCRIAVSIFSRLTMMSKGARCSTSSMETAL